MTDQTPALQRPATRAARLSAIEQALLTSIVPSQSQLSQILADQGIEVTQATLSRDLDEIHATKTRLADGTVAYALGKQPEEAALANPDAKTEQQMNRVLSGLVTIALRKGEPLQGKTIGIVGVGHVGKEVEKLCSAYGMNVLRNDPPRAEKEGKDGFVSLETIAEQADIVTFHTPLTKEGRFATRHLAGVDFFRKLQRKPWFVNASRGAVHDTDALLHARKEGKISELILDCWENEPDINRELLELATIATPHIAGFSADGKANGTRMCLKNIEKFFQVKIEKISEVIPPAPETPVIDLNRFDRNRIEQAILTSFNPLAIDRALRENPDRFEWFRTNYHHPREYGAYTIVHATPEETGQLRRLGFGIQQ